MAKKDYTDWSRSDLIKEIDQLRKRKKYGLVWENKPEDVVEKCKIELPVLEEIKEKEISTDSDKPNNLLIEGDNFHALSVLNYTHKGKIDLIYIDPPYNTGKKKEFKYNDQYVDKLDSYRHSKWLSFMSERLKLAKNLLKKTGVIFIAIDDNEIAQLKLLSDEIFGEQNFINVICWKSRDSVSNDLILSQNHNFHLLYAKNFQTLFNNRKLFRLEKEIKGFSNPDNDPNGPWKLTPVDGPGGARKGNPHYEFLGIKGYWRYSKETMEELYNAGLIIKRKKTLAKKYYQYQAESDGGMSATTWWDDIGTTTEGTKELREVIGQNDFNNPKPTSLIMKILELSIPKKGIILDFMAGSGTTGHAVLKMNKIDNLKRQFILCTNNEDNICNDICYPRIKNAINGYTTSKGKEIDGLGGNLKYFKTSFIPAEPTDKNKIKLTQKVTEMLCIKENTFEEVISTNQFKLFRNKNNFTGIIYDYLAIEDLKKEINKYNGKYSLYIFSLSDETFDDEFEDLKNKVRISPIPEAILRVYRRIFK
jgi:adenine-specific DNA-methyltransferase